MKSIRRYLTLRLLLGVLTIIILGSGMLYLFLRHQIVANFDRAMEAQVRALAGMIEEEEEGIEVEIREGFLPEYTREEEPEYYQVWDEDGTVLERSPSLEEKDLPFRSESMASPLFWNLELPDGRAGRAVGISFLPHVDEDESHLIESQTMVHVVMARDRGEISALLLILLFGSAFLVFIIMTATVVLVPRIVGSGLAPLRRLADHTEKIDSRSLDAHFSAEGLPDELRPIVVRLNELLTRIEEAFSREKRLTNDIAHELKTPIAELRTFAEVALQWPEDLGFTEKALRGTLEISQIMNDKVSVLLALGRCETGTQAVSVTSLQMKPLVVELWQPWQKLAEEKNMAVTLDVPEEAELTTDRMMFSSILSNMFSNAVEHCPVGGAIECTVGTFHGGYRLVLKNSNGSLTEEDLPHLFRHLWRKDAARSDSQHSGLGLTLVEAFTRILGIEVHVELAQAGDFRMTLEIPRRVESRPAAGSPQTER
jgi:two-component system sensor histidine kinase QseC